MDIGALATAFVGAKTAQMQLAFAARLLRMSTDASASAVKIIEAAQQSMDRLGNVAAGTGRNLDISI
jgi:hypothetical protein